MNGSGLYEQVMSSVPEGARPESRVRASAGVVPWRRRGKELEVFWVERSTALNFMGGFHAFPGGGRSRSDVELEVGGAPAGVERGPVDGAMPASVLDGVELEPIDAPGIAGCVAREVFEEIGLLLADDLQTEVAESDRDLLLSKKVSFKDLARERAWNLDVSHLVYAGRWLTPPLGPLRFDNRFFLLEWPPERRQQPRVCGSELSSGEWVRPAEALERWRRGEIMTAPPILHILEALAEDGPEQALERLRSPLERNLGPYRWIEFRPGIVMFPLPTLTLPPASHTNAYVMGLEETVLVDPGTPFADHQAGLCDALQAMERAGRKVSAIWLTHHHPDHVGAVDILRQRLEVPVCAHPHTAAGLAPLGIAIDRELGDGQRIVLSGKQPFPVRVVHTPGHARGHLTFFEESYGSLVGGDLTAGLGTIVIDPPEGNMNDYLESLRVAKSLGARTLFPAHGPPTVQVEDKLDEYVRHRLWREDRIRALWAEGHRGEELLAAAYDDTPAIALPLARRQLLAHLERLEGLGTVSAGAADRFEGS